MAREGRSLARGAVAAWPVAELLVTVGVQIVLTPLLLHRLGAQAFGVWVLVQTLLLAAPLLSLGASAGVLPVFSKAVQQGASAAAHAALRWLQRRVLLSAMAALAGTALALGLGLLPATPGPLPAPWWLALAALAWVVLTDLDGAAGSSLKAHGRFAFAAQTEAVARVLQLALTALWVQQGDSVLEPVLIAVLITLAKLVVRRAALRRHAPDDPAPPSTDAARATRAELAVTGAWVWAGSLGSLVFYAFDRWFVGAWLGTSVLAAYAVCTQLAQLPHAVASAASQVLVPWAARHAAGTATSAARGGSLRMLAAATALAALPALLLLPLVEPLLALWISPAFAIEHAALARGLALVFLVLSLNAPGYFMLLGMGRARFATAVSLASGVVFVAGALLLPRELWTFVALKGVFALLSLALPLGCAYWLRMPAASSR